MAKERHRTIEDDCFGSKPMRNKINSKAKGNLNERNACKPMQQWTGQKFCRVPQSGAIRRVNNDGVVADIMPDTKDTAFYFPFTVETKALKTIYAPKMLPNDSAIFTIWNQVSTDAVRAEKLPMALLRCNQMPAKEYYIILERQYGGSIMLMSGIPVAFTGFNGKYDLIGFMLSDVIAKVRYKLFANAIKCSNFAYKSKIYYE